MNEIHSFLEEIGFEIIDFDESESFGDKFYTYSNNVIKLRFISDKSVKSIDVKKNNTDEIWWDLALVRALIDHEERLNITISFDDLLMFLKKEINSINLLFNNTNYNSTKTKLESLKNKRAKQMFPNNFR